MEDFQSDSRGVSASLYQPLTPEQHKQRFMEEYAMKRWHIENEKNRRQAIKEVFQEQMQNAVRPNERLNAIFQNEVKKRSR